MWLVTRWQQAHAVIKLALGLWQLAYQRLRYELALSSALLAGWLAAVALVAAIPMYTDAINQALLRKELQNDANSRRPAFAFFFNYTASNPTVKVAWDRYFALDQYMDTQLVTTLGLAVQARMHYVKSDLFQLFSAVGTTYERDGDALERVQVGFIAGLDDHITLVEGSRPQSAWVPGELIEVMVAQSFAEKLGLQVGERYVLFNPAGVAGAIEPISLPVHIVGIWAAADPTTNFWYIAPAAFESTLLVAPANYTGALGDLLPRPLYDLGWYWVFDGGGVRAEAVEALLGRISQVQSQIGTIFSGVRLSLSPVSALQRYQVAVAAQAILILLLGLPVVGLILLFIALIANSMVEHQQLEIAILRSRGSGAGQIAAIYLFQGLTLAMLALLFGLPLGWLAAQAMGSTRQFLTFDRSDLLSVVITPTSGIFALLALGLALVVTIAPALRVAHVTIVTIKQQTGRATTRTHLRRTSLDLLLLAAAGYGYYLLAGQGRIAQLGWGIKSDPWENPLLFVAPTLFLLAGARLTLYCLPALLFGLERLVSQLPGVSMLLSLRNLARSRQQYTTLIVLLLLTASLGAYVTSFAHTLDENLTARTYYRIGAQVSLIEAAGVIADSLDAPNQNTNRLNRSSATTQNASPVTGLRNWAILPFTEHLRVPGIEAAARVGRYPANVKVADGVIEVELYGIDREDFPRVAYFRRDFAPLPLGSLMNELALEPAGILVSRSFLQRTTLHIGDTLELRGLIAGASQPLLFKIVGVVDLFPTTYPSGEQEHFIANLEYIFTQLGGPIPYEVWLTMAKGVTLEQLLPGLEEVGFQVLEAHDVASEIRAEQTRPARIGLLGFLSLGFVVTTFLSILALVTHAFLMYRRRFVQLGMLRALGLSARQVAVILAAEQFITSGLGVLGGAWLGLLCSQLFVPFMQLGYQPSDLVPPFEVIIAWQEIYSAVVVLLGMSLVITISVAWLLTRLQMFQAIKLGETV